MVRILVATTFFCGLMLATQVDTVAQVTTQGRLPAPPPPTLISPVSGAMVDNARSDGLDILDWKLQWTGVPWADAYEVRLRVSGAASVHLFVNQTTHRVCRECKKGLPNRATGSWSVRAWRQGKPLTEWSAAASFSVEPVNSDPPLGNYSRVINRLSSGGPNQIEYDPQRGRIRIFDASGRQDWARYHVEADSVAIRGGAITLFPSGQRYSTHWADLGVVREPPGLNPDRWLEAIPSDPNLFQVKQRYSGARLVPGIVTSSARTSRPAAKSPREPLVGRVSSPKRTMATPKPDVRPRGPSNQRMDLVPLLQTETPLDDLELVRQLPAIFWDANPDSGVFYYLPNRYHLAWKPAGDAIQGYGMRIHYEAGVAGENQIKIAMRLASGVTSLHLNVCTQLVQEKWQANKPSVKKISLRPYPLREKPIAKLFVRHLQIPDAQIRVQTFTDVSSPIDLVARVDAFTKENLQLDLEQGLGLTGEVAIATNEPDSQLVIPIHVQLDDAAALGHRDWQRDRVWKNESPYRLRLRGLHAVVTYPRSQIRSWELRGGSRIISPGQTVSIDDRLVPYYYGQGTAMWVEFEVAEETAEIRSRIFKEITGGVDSLATRPLKLRTLSPLRDTNVHHLQVYLRSRYLHPTVRTLRTKPAVYVGKDNEVYSLGAIHMVNREPGQVVKGDPLAQYRIEVVLEDGTRVRSDAWHDLHELELTIGSKHVLDVLEAMR